MTENLKFGEQFNSTVKPRNKIAVLLIFYFLLSGSIGIGCKKTSASTDLKETQQEKIPENPPEKPLVKALLPVKMKAAQFEVTLKYLDDLSMFLTEIKSSDGYTSKIAYNKEGYPSKFEKYKNDVLFQTVYYYRDNKKLIDRVTRFDYDAKREIVTPKGYYTLGYDANEQLTSIKNYGITKQLLYEEALTYTADGNIQNNTISGNSAQNNSTNYTYNNKNGIFKHLPYAHLWAIEAENQILHPGKNNRLSNSSTQKPVENSTYSYKHTSSDYPEEMSRTKNKVTEVFKISYKELKP